MQKNTGPAVENNIDRGRNTFSIQRMSFCLNNLALWSLFVCVVLIGLPANGQDTPLRGQPTLQPWVGEVKGSVVNIRTGPSLNHYSFLRLRGGTSLISVGGQGDWIEVAVPSDRPVWIHNDYLGSEGEYFRVNGSRVRLRATPGTNHAPLGLSELGQLLVPTGKVSPDGSWVEVLAPLNAHAWIHGDYIRRTDQKVDALQLAGLHQALKGQGGISGISGIVRAADPSKVQEGVEDDASQAGAVTGSEQISQEDTDPNAVTIPAFESPKLKSLFENFRMETKKNPVEWDFSAILREVKNIESSSEDIGEIEVVRDLSKTIQEHFVPLHRRLVKMKF